MKSDIRQKAKTTQKFCYFARMIAAKALDPDLGSKIGDFQYEGESGFLRVWRVKMGTNAVEVLAMSDSSRNNERLKSIDVPFELIENIFEVYDKTERVTLSKETWNEQTKDLFIHRREHLVDIVKKTKMPTRQDFLDKTKDWREGEEVSFGEIVSAYIRIANKLEDEIAGLFGVCAKTVRKWQEGKSLPLPAIQEHMVEELRLFMCAN